MVAAPGTTDLKSGKLRSEQFYFSESAQYATTERKQLINNEIKTTIAKTGRIKCYIFFPKIARAFFIIYPYSSQPKGW